MKTKFLLALAVLAWKPARSEEGLSYKEEILARARAEKLDQDSYWRTLLHYRSGIFSRYKSQIDDDSFFLSRRGKRSPSREMAATLESFFEPEPRDPDEPHAQCRFPARYAWLKERLRFDPGRLREVSCAEFEEWRGGFQAKSVSFIFASSYLNNPASMFGHTFLRLNRESNQPLLDYSISFAADTPTKNGLIFAIKGLLGGYPGRFSTEPYYFKVQKYNNMESRELWEYPLNLNPAQIDRLLAHLWELGRTYFNYYFLTDNCSYQLLPLLEAAGPAENLSSQYHFKAIPTDTVKTVLGHSGLAGKGRLRPSVLLTLKARRSLLTAQELSAAESLAKGAGEPDFSPLKPWPPARQALVLDSAYDYFRYVHHFARYQPAEANRREREILIRRKELGAAAYDLPPTEAFPPEAGHKSGRAGAGFGLRKGGSFEEISLRAALHDLSENPEGYVPASQLEMFHWVFRRDNDRRKIYMEKFTLVDIVSLSALDRWIRKPSWKFFLGWDNARDLGRPPEKALTFRTSGGSGAALQFTGLGRRTFYALGDVDAGAGGVFKRNARLGAGGAAGVLWEISPCWRTRLEGGWRRYFWGNAGYATRAEFSQSVNISENLEMRLTGRRDGPAQEILLMGHLYL